jgi:hypothetical protein
MNIFLQITMDAIYPRLYSFVKERALDKRFSKYSLVISELVTEIISNLDRDIAGIHLFIQHEYACYGLCRSFIYCPEFIDTHYAISDNVIYMCESNNFCKDLLKIYYEEVLVARSRASAESKVLIDPYNQRIQEELKEMQVSTEQPEQSEQSESSEQPLKELYPSLHKCIEENLIDHQLHKYDQLMDDILAKIVDDIKYSNDEESKSWHFCINYAYLPNTVVDKSIILDHIKHSCEERSLCSNLMLAYQHDVSTIKSLDITQD